MKKCFGFGLGVLMFLGPGFLIAEPVSFLEDRDIGALMDEAKTQFPLDQQDAVILFEGKKVVWTEDGRAQTTLHRIVWIGTEFGIRSFADLRIPYDAQRTSFKTLALRTWRESQWWVAGDTAKVDTLPFAVALASDYTHMREMMLLHDAIELPCILEMAYAIEDKEPFRGGIQGVWVFPKNVPAIRSALTFVVPSGAEVSFAKSKDVPDASESQDEEKGLTYHHWEMGPLDTIGLPETADPASYSPHVSYSTFKDWEAFGAYTDAVLQKALDDGTSIGEKWESCGTPNYVCADEIAKFIGEKTRVVHTDISFWLDAPRKASRTFETAYGHALDRAILAAVLLREAGFPVAFVFRGKSWENVDESVPSLGRFEGPAVYFGECGQKGIFDPVSSRISKDLSWLHGRTLWFPGKGAPLADCDDSKTNNLLKLSLDLALDAETNELKGTGTLESSGTLSLFDAMHGAQDEALKTLSSVVGGVLQGAEVTAYNPQAFGGQQVSLGFELHAKLGEKDVFERISLIVGQPNHGLVDHLGPDVAISLDKRSSPVTLPATMSQEIRISIDMGDREILWVPKGKKIENIGGNFMLSTHQDGNKLTLTRSIAITKSRFSSSEWPNLRALLLAEQHEQNGSVFLKP